MMKPTLALTLLIILLAFPAYAGINFGSSPTRQDIDLYRITNRLDRIEAYSTQGKIAFVPKEVEQLKLDVIPYNFEIDFSQDTREIVRQVRAEIEAFRKEYGASVRTKMEVVCE